MSHRASYSRRVAVANRQPRWPINREIDEIINNIGNLCDVQQVDALVPFLERAGRWENRESLFSKLKGASRVERLNDYLAEMKFGIIFEDIGFETTIVAEAERPTPDLKVSRDGLDAYVEVKHFRRTPPGNPEAEKLYINDSFFRRFGSPERDVMKALLRIRDKYRQVRGSVPGIIALWNDDEDIEPDEVGAAVDALVESDQNIPSNLQFVLFGTSWVAPGEERYLHCYPFESNGARAYDRWMTELEELRTIGFRSC